MTRTARCSNAGIERVRRVPLEQLVVFADDGNPLPVLVPMDKRAPVAGRVALVGWGTRHKVMKAHRSVSLPKTVSKSPNCDMLSGTYRTSCSTQQSVKATPGT